MTSDCQRLSEYGMCDFRQITICDCRHHMPNRCLINVEILQDFDHSAEAAFRRAIELNPDGIGNHQRLAIILLLRGEHEAALEVIENEPAEARRRSVRALIYHSMGNTERGQEEHEALIALGERWTYEIAEIFAYKGMTDEAFDWLDRAVARQDGSLWYLISDPFLDSIRDDPRFEEIERRLGINPKK